MKRGQWRVWFFGPATVILMVSYLYFNGKAVRLTRVRRAEINQQMLQKQIDQFTHSISTNTPAGLPNASVLIPAPTELKAEPQDDGSLEFDWKEPAEDLKYNLYALCVGSTSAKKVNTEPLTDNSFTWRLPKPNSPCMMYVTALNAKSQESAPSNVIPVGIKMPDVKPEKADE